MCTQGRPLFSLFGKVASSLLPKLVKNKLFVCFHCRCLLSIDLLKTLSTYFFQEFSETGVKTVIQSNKNFKMSETPARMSSETFEAIKAGTKPLDSIQAAHEEVDKKDPEHSPLDADSGIFSVRNSCDSPANTMNYYVREQQNIKPSYTQVNRLVSSLAANKQDQVCIAHNSFAYS